MHISPLIALTHCSYSRSSLNFKAMKAKIKMFFYIYNCSTKKALTLLLSYGCCCSRNNVTLLRLLAGRTQDCGQDTLCAVSTPSTNSYLHLGTEQTFIVNTTHNNSRLCIDLEISSINTDTSRLAGWKRKTVVMGK